MKARLVRWWKYRVFWPAYRTLMPRRTKRIFAGYWTYSKPGKQWGPWLDRTFISDKWRGFAKSADFGPTGDE